jgi:hypothetical protein
LTGIVLGWRASITRLGWDFLDHGVVLSSLSTFPVEALAFAAEGESEDALLCPF